MTGPELSALRLKHGLTLSALAKLAGYKRVQSIQNVIDGRANMHPDTLALLLHRLGERRIPFGRKRVSN